jgi:TonB family protein
VQFDKTDVSDKVDRNTGVLTINAVPGSHTLIVRQLGYSDGQETVELKRGENDLITITLEPLQGKLNVSPNVEGARIEVRNADTNRNVVTTDLPISNLGLPPGDYDVTGSKSGYLTKLRKITIKSGENTHVELLLEPEPKPEPQRKAEPAPLPGRSLGLDRSFKADSTMAMRTSREGKDIIVTLTGRSGIATNSVGTVDVTLNPSDLLANSSNVGGMLTGFPCRVGLVRLENVSDQLSFVETPGIRNEWGSVTVRLRSKDSKHAVHFAINWTLIQQSASTGSQNDVLVNAEVLKRVTPIFPSAARNINIAGYVLVFVLIDEQGDVKSAKATDGPLMLRPAAEDAARQWKFRPATRSGVPVQSTQTLSFNFQR